MAATWHALFKKWAKRLGSQTNWKCKTVADPNLDKDHLATTTYELSYRIATFRYRPGSTPNNAVACHEAVHLLVARLADAAEKASADNGDVAKAWLDGATEEVVEEITNLFLAAYNEE